MRYRVTGMRGMAATLVFVAAVCCAAEGAQNDVFPRIRRISRQVERIRQLAFTQEVATAVQDVDGFHTYVRDAVAEQYGGEEVRDYVRALVRLGALDTEIDLAETVIALLDQQAAAYYEPEEKTYFLLMTNAPPLIFDIISAHELCHALQDQHFDLHALLEGDVGAARDNGDALMARSSLVEGGATWVMTAWMIMHETGLEEPALAEAAASMAIMGQAGLDFDSIVALTEGGLPAAGLDVSGIELGLTALRESPRFLVEQLLASYFQGAMMVDQVRRQGGWEAVNALYRDPPASTEQILHPGKLAGERDLPVDVRIDGLAGRLPDGWRVGEEDVLGELGIRILLDRWRPEGGASADAWAAAAGWGGDRYYYCVNPTTEGALLVWRTVWDSEQDAIEFAVAYRLALARRFPGLRKAWRSEPQGAYAYQVWEVEPGRFLKLMRKGATVGIIDATGPERVKVLWEREP